MSAVPAAAPPSPLLVVRADADSRIGCGHVMRALALAQEWRRQGGKVVFLGRIEQDSFRQRLAAEGCEVTPLPASHPDPRDVQTLRAWLQKKRGQDLWLALDGYRFDDTYQQALRADGWPLLIIDDYAHLPLYHADILVNPNAYASVLPYSTDADTLRLLGARYALLRQEFSAPPPASAVTGEGPSPESHHRILVTMGGADPDNAGARIVEALLATKRHDLEVKILIGPLNPHRPALARQLADAPFRTELLAPVMEMVPLLRWTDLAITAAGSTCWEMASQGVPMVVTVLAENQERVAAAVAEYGLGVNLGWHHAFLDKQAAAAICDLLASPAQRRQMSERGKRLLDGQGAARVVRAMRLYHFTLRPATADDCETVFAWANDPETREVSFHQEAIAWPEHCQWFANRLADPATLFSIAVGPAGESLGQVRFALDGTGHALISVGLSQEIRGLGLGSRLIRQACDQAMAIKGLHSIRALIKPENTASRRAFAKAGFLELSTPTAVTVPQPIIMEYTREGQRP